MWVLTSNSFVVLIIVSGFLIKKIVKLIKPRRLNNENSVETIRIIPMQSQSISRNLQPNAERNQILSINVGDLASNHLVEETKSNKDFNIPTVSSERVIDLN